MTSRAQSWTRNVGGGVLPQPSNNIDTTLSELQVWSSNSSQNKVSAKPIATRLGFVVLHCSRSGGPDTVPSTAYEQQLETPMNIKHILRGRFWTQLRIQNSACRRFTMPPFTFRSIRRHRTPSHSFNQLFLFLTSIFINLAGHSHRIPADVGFPLYKVVTNLKTGQETTTFS